MEERDKVQTLREKDKERKGEGAKRVQEEAKQKEERRREKVTILIYPTSISFPSSRLCLPLFPPSAGTETARTDRRASEEIFVVDPGCCLFLELDRTGRICINYEFRSTPFAIAPTVLSECFLSLLPVFFPFFLYLHKLPSSHFPSFLSRQGFLRRVTSARSSMLEPIEMCGQQCTKSKKKKKEEKKKRRAEKIKRERTKSARRILSGCI